VQTIKTLFLTSVACLAAGAAWADAPNVVASIKPVHSLVAAIMQGVGQPKLIVEGAASPHIYSLKPSNAKVLENADVIFWVGHGLEAFLEKPLEALASKAKVVELDDAPGLEKLAFREGGAFEAHDHGDDDHGAGHDGHDHGTHDHQPHDHDAKGETPEAHHHDHDEGEFDMHLWLDPANARAMAAEIAKTLAAADPANAAAYAANATALNLKLEALDTELAATVAPIKDKPFVVFHDAYQYFEHRYGVKVAGSITVSPESMPGAERISEIHAKVKQLNATCVFAEPQFEPRLVKVVTEGTAAKSATLDPEAATLTEGPELYFTLMRGIATSLKNCLGTTG
jgi:zinc transport system substrate-binding protein